MHMRALLICLLWMVLLPLAVSAAPPVPNHAKDIWRRQVEDRGLDPEEVVHPLTATAEMHELASRVAGQREPREQLRHLQQYLFDTDQFPFNYDARGTYTAREAFQLREGNCVSFTNLFIALGRSLGIPLQAALIRRGDSELDGNLVVVNNHMVAIYQHSDGVTIYDFSQSRGDRIAGLFIMDDVWVSSIYLNNKGVEAIRAESYDRAIGLLTRALRLTPEFTAIHGNLGVAYRLAGDLDRAFDVYQQALELEARDPSVLNNLARLLSSMGREEEAQAALKAASLREATPYLLITRGDLEAREGDHRRALKMYKKAKRADPDLADPWVAMAQAQLALGKERAAHRSLRKALKLEPAHAEARKLAERLGVESATDG